MSDAIRSRSAIVSAKTPRGQVDAAYQERKGLRQGSGWHRVYLARRGRTHDWHDGSTLREAVRKALLLPARNQPGWLASVITDLSEKLEPAQPGA